MSRYISSVSVTFAPKDSRSTEPMLATVLAVDYVVGVTVPHVVHYVNNNPLIRQHLNKYHIINLTFQYSEL